MVRDSISHFSVRRFVGPSVTFLNSERFLHYCSCPTVRDWIAVYPALFYEKHPNVLAAEILAWIIFHSQKSKEEEV